MPNITVNVRNTSGYPVPNVFIGAVGTDITIDGNVNSGVNTATEAVTDDSSVIITITKSGYHTYTNTVTVFDEAITLEIFLVAVITNNVDANYQNPYTYFNKYRKPCSYNYYIVDGSSFPAAEYKYYLNRILKGSTRNGVLTFNCIGSYQIGYEKISYYDDTVTVWWDQYFINTNQVTINIGTTTQTQTALFDNDVAPNIIISEYKPSLVLDVEVTDNACAGGDCECIPLNSTITVSPTIILNNSACTEGVPVDVNSKTNGDFSSATEGWTYFDASSFNNSPLGTYEFIWQAASFLPRRGIISTDLLTIGQEYQVTFTLSSLATTGEAITFRVIDDIAFTNTYYTLSNPSSGDMGIKTFTFTAASTGLIFVLSNSAGTHSMLISEVVINEIVEATLKYDLYNNDGVIVDTLSYSIVSPIDNSLYPYTYYLTEIGDYTLKSYLTNCCNTCQLDTDLHGCDFIKIEETSCHVYTIKNCSGLNINNVTFTITDLDNNIIQSLQNIELDFSQNYVFTSTVDNVYKLTVKDLSNEVIRVYILIDLCGTINCITNKLLNFLCPDCDCADCVDCVDENCKNNYELNRIVVIGYDLMSRINREYKLNSFYTVLDESKIAELRSIQDDLDAINTYCSNCSDSSNTINFSSASDNTTKSDCGCS